MENKHQISKDINLDIGNTVWIIRRRNGSFITENGQNSYSYFDIPLLISNDVDKASKYLYLNFLSNVGTEIASSYELSYLRPFEQIRIGFLVSLRNLYRSFKEFAGL